MDLAEVAAQARMDGDITPEEADAVFDSIDELRQEAEVVLVAIHPPRFICWDKLVCEVLKNDR